MSAFTVQGLTAIINEVLPEPHAGLLAGLLFGTRATLPQDLYNSLVQSGTIHIIALSGMNIAILGRIITTAFTGLLGRRNASLLTLLAIVWFVWFVGPSATIVRAAIMGGISVLALVLGRQYWGLLSWAIAIGSMVGIHPAWITDISFQLSAVATLGIILFGGSSTVVSAAGLVIRSSMNTRGEDTKFSLIAFRAPRQYPYRNETFGTDKQEHEEPRVAYQENFVPTSARYMFGLGSILLNTVKEDLRLTLAAQVFTIPLILFYFRRLSLIAPIANVFITWSIPLLTGLGWATVLVGWIWFPMSYIIAWADWIFLEYIIRTVQILGFLPYAGITF